MKRIRLAKAEDIGPMLAIYAPHIATSAASFEAQAPTLAEFGARVREYAEKFPWLVYDLDGQVAGYAYASSHRARSAYSWSVESSVYVHDSFHRQGVATELYRALLDILKAQGATNILAGITLPNEKSVAFHEGFGFAHVGTYVDIGYKLGQWWSVGWWQLSLPKPSRPAPLGSPPSSFEIKP